MHNGLSTATVEAHIDTLEANTDGLETLMARPATATRTSVASVTTAGGVTILASNANRKGATITNTDANALYLMFAAAGSVASTDFDVKLLTDETLYIDREGYTGIVSGVWAGDGSGHAKVSEFT